MTTTPVLMGACQLRSLSPAFLSLGATQCRTLLVAQLCLVGRRSEPLRLLLFPLGTTQGGPLFVGELRVRGRPVRLREEEGGGRREEGRKEGGRREGGGREGGKERGREGEGGGREGGEERGREEGGGKERGREEGGREGWREGKREGGGRRREGGREGGRKEGGRGKEEGGREGGRGGKREGGGGREEGKERGKEGGEGGGGILQQLLRVLTQHTKYETLFHWKTQRIRRTLSSPWYTTYSIV